MINEINKKCKHCGQIAPHRWRRSKAHPKGGYYRNCCNSCHRRQTKQWYKDNRNYANEYVAKRRKTLKKLLVEYKGGRCHDCGLVEEPYIYDFHHLDPETKDFDLCQHMWGSIQQLQQEVDKCVLLCANCHRHRHHRQKNDLQAQA